MILRDIVMSASGLIVLAMLSSPASAQSVPDPMDPPGNFETAEEHYRFLHDLHRGGTVHTYDTVPQWEGLWSSSGNGLWGTQPFLEGGGPGAYGLGATVAEGVLTPEYEAAFRQRRENMEVYGEQPYDRLTTCESAGMPRWLLEPYVREFVNTPTQSWWLNDLANDTRRIYINQDHQNIDGAHSPLGDSVGFWADDMLIVHTSDLWPADWFRGQPPTSNEMEVVEVYRLETYNNGRQRIVVNATFYDPLSLLEPMTLVYTFQRNVGLERAGFRIRHWDCDSSVQVRTDEATTTIRLPGETGLSWHQMRNPDLPADLSGQTRTPGEFDFDTLDFDGF